MTAMVLMTSAELDEIVRKAVEDGIAKALATGWMEAASTKWLSVAQVMQRYRISRRLVLTLINDHKLPASPRNFPGGCGWVIRASDAHTILGTTHADRH